MMLNPLQFLRHERNLVTAHHLMLYYSTDSKGQKASGGLPDARILNNWRADMM